MNAVITVEGTAGAARTAATWTWGQALKRRTLTTGAVVTAIGALILATPYRPKDWASRRYAWDPNAHEYHGPRSSS